MVAHGAHKVYFHLYCFIAYLNKCYKDLNTPILAAISPFFYIVDKNIFSMTDHLMVDIQIVN